VNIVLNKLDQKMEDIKKSFNKGAKRAKNKEYDAITSRLQTLRKNKKGSSEIKKLAATRRYHPSLDPFDSNFKRLMYLRYADDFVILVIGSINEAKHIKHQVADILNKKCGLELHKDKTIITASKDGFKFLGAWCKRISATKAGLSKNKAGNPAKYRMRMKIEIPIKDLIAKLKINKYIKTDFNEMPTATARKDLINLSHYEIVTFYNHRIT